MKGFKLTLGMALLFSSAAAMAFDGTVNFNGEIIDNTCTVALGNGSNSLVVPMGSVNKSSFTGRGSIASTTQFVLTMTECPSVNARVKFDGQAYDGDDTVLPLFTPSSVYALQEGEPNDLKFYASYIAMSNSVTAGAANSVANFTVTYN